MMVVGIDPGSRCTGWGCVEQDGSRLVLRDAGVLKCAPNAPLEARMARLHEGLVDVLGQTTPGVVAMESVFHGVNTRSLVVLGQARGALMAAVGGSGIRLDELTPAEVKKAVTGRGSATKDQVGHMVGVLLGPDVRRLEGLPADATDALAVAIAAIHRATQAERLGSSPEGTGIPAELRGRIGRRRRSRR